MSLIRVDAGWEGAASANQPEEEPEASSEAGDNWRSLGEVVDELVLGLAEKFIRRHKARALIEISEGET
jgi:hypothetical protein